MNESLIEDEDFYFNEAGMMVLTEKYLRQRGYCCGNGCLHCPFDFAAVPEPRKTFLLAEKKSRDNYDQNNFDKELH